MRNSIAVLLAAAVAQAAAAHAPYLIVTPAKDGKPATVQVVFSDNLKPDSRIKDATWKKLDGIKVTAVTQTAGKPDAELKWEYEGPVKLTKGTDCLTGDLPAGTQVVRGTVQYGTFAKGDGPVTLLTYHVKAVVGDTHSGPKPADKGLDILPVRDGDTLRFAVTQDGKPAAGVEVSVLADATGKTEALTTAADGRTGGVPGRGRYGVTVRRVEDAAGEHAGQKYTKRSTVATLVVGE